MYADEITEAMDKSMKETARRRSIQESYNQEHGIIPKTIEKPISEVVTIEVKDNNKKQKVWTKKEKEQEIERIETQMKEAAKNLDFERAMELRDILFELKSE